MDQRGPNNLIVPESLVESSSGFLGISPMLLIVLGLVLIGAFLIYEYRRRLSIDPRELAFRTLSKRMGLSRSQTGLIRKSASTMGLASPIGIIMNQELTAQALTVPAAQS